MAIAMVAMLAFGGTYAYFTANAGTAKTASTTLGKIALDADSTVLATTSLVQNVLPSEKVFGEDGTTLTIKDESNRASFIFITVSATVAKAKAEGGYDTATAVDLTGTDSLHVPTGATNVYYILTTEGSGGTVGTAITISGLNIEIPAAWDNSYMLAKIDISFTVTSVQAAGFVDAEEGTEADWAAAALAQYQENGGIVSGT